MILFVVVVVKKVIFYFVVTSFPKTRLKRNRNV